MAPFTIDEWIPDYEEIDWAVRWMRYNCSGTPSGMRAEHLRKWLKEDRKTEAEAVMVLETGTETEMGVEKDMEIEKTEADPPALSNFQKVVDVAQAAFQKGCLSEYTK